PSPYYQEEAKTPAQRQPHGQRHVRRKQGKQKGKVEGMHEQAIKIALRMLEQGFEREITLPTTGHA
ncbi:hypothetical protein ACU4JH_26290, partial [Escherichia coli]